MRTTLSARERRIGALSVLLLELATLASVVAGLQLKGSADDCDAVFSCEGGALGGGLVVAGGTIVIMLVGVVGLAIAERRGRPRAWRWPVGAIAAMAVLVLGGVIWAQL
ncbi:hypothetical protein [Luteipulveratus halotolerans]|uniref:hypothetical protein n=1 Tax=Luteipulveratus halotolerans TaxID=1631356 RepID=UPI0012F930F7|nr:hypothetical protein [Luteipulveratus halotolerans]